MIGDVGRPVLRCHRVFLLGPIPVAGPAVLLVGRGRRLLGLDRRGSRLLLDGGRDAVAREGSGLEIQSRSTSCPVRVVSDSISALLK